MSFFVGCHLSSILKQIITSKGIESRYLNNRLGGKECSAMYYASATELFGLSGDRVAQIIDSVDTVLCDCDGVLWVDKQEIPGSAKALNALRAKGKRIFYVTNNSTKTRDEFVEKARSLGFDAEKEEVLSTAFLAAHYLKSINFTKKVYLIGTSGIAKELDAFGIPHFGVGPDHIQPDYREQIINNKLKLDPEVGAVVVGFDEHFSYAKLIKAASYLLNPNVLFIGTNTDERFPLASGLVMPGTGSIVRSVETCAERLPHLLGKPEKYIGKFLGDSNLRPERTLMIGDRCNTDIEFGVRCGFQTLLVLSGVTSMKDISENLVKPLPDFIIPSLGDLTQFLQ